MGGTIAITVRLPDGTEHRMARWTNALPNFLVNAKFYEKDSHHAQEYVKRGKDMQEDYKKHKKDRKFEFPMSPVYGGYTQLAPDGYGLVVVDMVNNKVLHSQGYTDFNYRTLLDVFGDLQELEEICALVKGGYATKATKNFDDVFKKNYIEVTESTIELLKECSMLFVNNYGPFTFVRYKEGDKKQLQKFMQDVKDLGFVLTDKEESRWKRFIAGRT